MCGRFALSATTDDIENLLPELKINAEPIARYNIAPSQNIYAIINSAQPVLTALRWGLIPSWAKDESIGNRIINARAETLTEKPAFRNLIKRKRCLVLATGYYEWRKNPGEKRKQPYYIMVKNENMITFAALWDECRSPDGRIIRSATLITRPATNDIAFIHNRMPVIIDKNNRKPWLDTNKPLEDILEILKQSGNKNFKYYPVSLAVNNPAFDDIKCIEKAE